MAVTFGDGSLTLEEPMATKPVYWRNVIRQQFRLPHDRNHMHLLKWQAKRSKPKKEYVFLVWKGDVQYVVVVEA